MFAASKSKLAVVVAIVVGLATAGVARADGSYNFGQGYMVDNPDVTCQTDFDASGNVAKRNLYVDTPTMFSPISNQRVSYQPILTRWNGSAWVNMVIYPEVFGTTAAQMPGNYGFNVPLTGAFYWRVSIKYRWYWGSTVSRVQHLWAGTHQLFFVRDGYTPVWSTAGSYCLLNITRAN